ncbi:MAG: xanthine dehydrogenase family protein subunit M [Spirochaetales bacterium]|nr:xanthine dehydrogenase family protein subunit M [Spirochaetales bacterium]
MDYYKPGTISEALALQSESFVFIAGGTDLGVLLFDFISKPEGLIDITEIDELCGIRSTGKEIIIGACTGIDEIAANSSLPVCLAAGAASIGSPQIRNMATIGGNICNASPCGDTLTPLIVLDADFVVAGVDGEKTLKACDFFLGPKKTILKEKELLKEVRFSAGKLKGLSGFRMIGKRNGQAISQVNAALWIDVQNGTIKEIRIAAGAVAPVPLSLVKTEQAVTGLNLDKDTVKILKDTAENEIKPISDVRATDNYRRMLVGAMLEEMLCEIMNPGAV